MYGVDDILFTLIIPTNLTKLEQKEYKNNHGIGYFKIASEFNSVKSKDDKVEKRVVIQTPNLAKIVDIEFVNGIVDSLETGLNITSLVIVNDKEIKENNGKLDGLGEYFITPFSENIDDGLQKWDDLSLKSKSASWIGGILSWATSKKIGSWLSGTIGWGEFRIPIQPKTKQLIDQNGNIIIRSNFFIHGGTTLGSAECIDLMQNNNTFFL